MPRQRTILVSLPLLLGSAALAQPENGTSFVTIGSPGNAPWPGNGTVGDQAIGRGAVGYSYRMGQYEVTTSQWVNFFNAAYDRPQSDWLPNLTPPTFWGAVATTPHTPGGMRWTVPAGNEMLPVGNISWRMAAMYCNWMCNGAIADDPNRSVFLNGAYDASTFHYVGNGFADQPTHNPGAQYWIPTWDEWLKAAHYDPNKNGPGQGGWWVYSNGTNSPLVGAPPPSLGGNGQANFGFTISGGVHFNSIPLGAYLTTSPSGLFDMAGGTTEWTEDIITLNDGTMSRRYDGSEWGSPPGVGISDAIFADAGDEFPSISSYNFGFRIASAVPGAPGLAAFFGFAALAARRRRQNY
jgi:formylglycine-generating enzyme required for sulfatase activity